MNKIGQPIRLHPQWLQFIASEGFIIPIPIALIFIAGYDGFPFTQLIPLLMGLSGIFIIGLIYKYSLMNKYSLSMDCSLYKGTMLNCTES